MFTSCFVTWCWVPGGRIGEVSDKKTNFPHSLPQVASTWIALQKSKHENPISFAVWNNVGLFDKSRSTTWWQDLLEMWEQGREVEESLTSCCVRWLMKYGCGGLEMWGELVVGRESTSSNTLVFCVKTYFILNYLFSLFLLILWWPDKKKIDQKERKENTKKKSLQYFGFANKGPEKTIAWVMRKI